MAEDEQLSPMGEWVSDLMSDLVLIISKAMEDAKETPDWFQTSFSSHGRVVEVSVTFSREGLNTRDDTTNT
jgi:hypothetical protein